MDNFDRMNGSKKAALFLMVMGEELTSNVFKHLDEAEIKTIGEEMTQIKKVDPKAISSLLDEFMQTLRGKGFLGLRGRRFSKKQCPRPLTPRRPTPSWKTLTSGRSPPTSES